MKAFIAVWLCIFGISSWAEEPYVLLGAFSSVKTKDGVILKLKPGDWVPYAGKNDSGAWVNYSIGSLHGSVPWHAAKMSAPTPEIRLAFKKVVQRLKDDYTEAIEKRQADRERAAEQAALREEQRARAAEEMDRIRMMNELQAIRQELEILNRRRMR